MCYIHCGIGGLVVFDAKCHLVVVVADGNAQVAFSVFALQFKHALAHLTLLDIVVFLETVEHGDAETHCSIGGREPIQCFVAHCAVVVVDIRGQSGDVLSFLHLDGRFKHTILNGKLHERAVVADVVLRNVWGKQRVGVVVQVADHFDVGVEVDAHDGFQLPSGQQDGVFRTRHTGLGIHHRHLCA